MTSKSITIEFSPTKFVGVISRSVPVDPGGYGELHRRRHHTKKRQTRYAGGEGALRSRRLWVPASRPRPRRAGWPQRNRQRVSHRSRRVAGLILSLHEKSRQSPQRIRARTETA